MAKAKTKTVKLATVQAATPAVDQAPKQDTKCRAAEVGHRSCKCGSEDCGNSR